MIRPTALTAAQLGIAVKPAVGYEGRFYFSPLQAVEIGELQIVTTNSGVWTQSPEIAGWTEARNVVAILDNGVNSQADLALTYGSCSATFTPVSHAGLTRRIFPPGAAQEVKNGGDTAYTNPSVAPTVVCHADAAGTKIKFFAIPQLDTYVLAPCKVNLAYPDPGAMPANIACGRDQGAYVKDGEIPPKSFRLTAKIPVDGDGLTRVPSQRITGLVKTVKEDKVTTTHTFFIGLFMKMERTTGESMEPDTMNFTGQYEDQAMIWAAGP